jgi:predicted neutral ceramidase superfamily lipid hydrolase
LHAALDLELAARALAVASLVGSIHADAVHNHVLFYNAKSRRLEPLLWDANGFAPGMNATLRDGLADCVDTLLLATTDNHYVNIRPGGHNPLSGADFILPAAQTALAEALADLAPAESAMGRVTIDGVEILGQGMQDRISAAANAVVQVARFSWLPLYGSAAMFCMLLSPYL